MTTRIQNIYDHIVKDKRTQNSLRFPFDLESSGHGNVIRFNINIPEGSKYLGGKGNNDVGINPATGKEVPVVRREGSNSLAARFSGNSVRTDTVIDLFMPPEIQTSYQSTWNTKSMGAIGGATDALATIGDDTFTDIARRIKEAGLNTFGGAVDSLTGFNVSDNMALSRNSVSNPYMEVLFEGVENRTFSFTFKMIPRNAQEQQTVREIVKTFKFHQAPELKIENSSQYWLFPSEFDIKFMHRGTDNPWLFRISTCALTNFSVDYSPEGQYSSHADGSPFATSISLQFTEMEVHTKENILQGF